MITVDYLKTVVTKLFDDTPSVIVRNICPNSGKAVLDSITINTIGELSQEQRKGLELATIIDDYWPEGDNELCEVVCTRTQ